MKKVCQALEEAVRKLLPSFKGKKWSRILSLYKVFVIVAATRGLPGLDEAFKAILAWVDAAPRTGFSNYMTSEFFNNEVSATTHSNVTVSNTRNYQIIAGIAIDTDALVEALTARWTARTQAHANSTTTSEVCLTT
jgi:hypothetical protein